MEIGKTYLVPAVRVNKFRGFNGWLPVIGPLHEDGELVKFPWDHFHVDWRLTPRRFIDRLTGYRGASYLYASVIMLRDTAGVQVIVDGPTPKRMTCKRVLPPYPWKSANWLPELQKQYACAKLINGKCPHRGIPADAMIRLEGGILECPGHGLRWNAATGEAVMR